MVAEDDSSDLTLLRHAVTNVDSSVRLQITRDGNELIRYLQGDGEFADRDQHPVPDLIMLDLKMPQLSGFEVLKWLRNHPEYVLLPKIILSGSTLEKDIEEAYELGANTYFTKPSSFHDLEKLMRLVVGYWSESQPPVARILTRCDQA